MRVFGKHSGIVSHLGFLAVDVQYVDILLSNYCLKLFELVAIRLLLQYAIII